MIQTIQKEKTMIENILLVEDDDIDAEEVSRSLKKAKIDIPVLRAKDGIFALEILKERKLIHDRTLILLDLNMPRMNGLDFLEELKSLDMHKGTSIYILTSSDDTNDLLKAYDYPIKGYALKDSETPPTNEFILSLNELWNSVRIEFNSPAELNTKDEKIDNLNIVYIEDDEIDRMQLSRTIKEITSFNINLKAAKDLDTGLELIRSSHPDLILTDLSLPDAENDEAIYILYGNFPEIPILALTGNESFKLTSEILSLGAQDYILKETISSKSLAQSIQGAITRKSIENKLIKNSKKIEREKNIKESFLTLISHDLRSPLGNLRAFIEIIKEDKENKLTEKSKEALDFVEELSETSFNMLQGLLSSFRDQSDQIQLQKRVCNLDHLLRNIAEKQRPQLRPKSFKLDFARNLEKLEVEIDPTLIEVVLNNIYSNAIKFCPNGTTIKCRSVKVDEYLTKITIEDDGPGLSQDKLNGLFNPKDYTPSVGTNGEEGTGFGLPFCKKIITAHGGSITANNVNPTGLRFEITLPNS